MNDKTNSVTDALQPVAAATVCDLRAQLAEPIDMVLHCPACGMQHIDAVEELPMPMPGSSFEGSAGWVNPPHRSHLCHGCGQIEVGAYEPVCPECRKSLEQAGVLKPQDQRQQIGPLDV